VFGFLDRWDIQNVREKADAMVHEVELGSLLYTKVVCDQSSIVLDNDIVTHAEAL